MQTVETWHCRGPFRDGVVSTVTRLLDDQVGDGPDLWRDHAILEKCGQELPAVPIQGLTLELVRIQKIFIDSRIIDL
jgi:hypothetical protein